MDTERRCLTCMQWKLESEFRINKCTKQYFDDCNTCKHAWLNRQKRESDRIRRPIRRALQQQRAQAIRSHIKNVLLENGYDPRMADRVNDQTLLRADDARRNTPRNP